MECCSTRATSCSKEAESDEDTGAYCRLIEHDKSAYLCLGIVARLPVQCLASACLDLVFVAYDPITPRIGHQDQLDEYTCQMS